MKRLTFTSQIIKEGEMYVAYCPELDVSSCGYEVAEAKDNLREAVRLFLEEAYRMGTLYDILIEAGYQVDEKDLLSPTISVETMEVAVGVD